MCDRVKEREFRTLPCRCSIHYHPSRYPNNRLRRRQSIVEWYRNHRRRPFLLVLLTKMEQNERWTRPDCRRRSRWRALRRARVTTTMKRNLDERRTEWVVLQRLLQERHTHGTAVAVTSYYYYYYCKDCRDLWEE